jgi:hypothetical protein
VVSEAPMAVQPPACNPPVSTLSYSSLAEYQRCGYRFYLERVLGIPSIRRHGAGADAGTRAAPASEPPGGARRRRHDAAPRQAVLPGTSPSPELAGAAAGREFSGADRGVLVHALLERLDFRRPSPPTPQAIAAACASLALPEPGKAQAAELARLIAEFAATALCDRLGRARQVRREQRFNFVLNGFRFSGSLDVLARELSGALVVDYKSDRLGDARPIDVVANDYGIQRLAYALAILRTGPPRVEVVHVFLERPEESVGATFDAADAPRLQADLSQIPTATTGRPLSRWSACSAETAAPMSATFPSGSSSCRGVPSLSPKVRWSKASAAKPRRASAAAYAPAACSLTEVNGPVVTTTAAGAAGGTYSVPASRSPARAKVNRTASTGMLPAPSTAT